MKRIRLSSSSLRQSARGRFRKEAARIDLGDVEKLVSDEAIMVVGITDCPYRMKENVTVEDERRLIQKRKNVL